METEEYEDEQLAELAIKRLHEMHEDENISWEEACKLAGWEDKENI